MNSQPPPTSLNKPKICGGWESRKRKQDPWGGWSGYLRRLAITTTQQPSLLLASPKPL